MSKCLLTVAAAMMLTACAHGLEKEEHATNTGDPIVTLRYSCDPSRTLGKSLTVPEKCRLVIRTTGNETLYFVVETDYVDKSGVSKHDALHYVLGGENGQGAEAIVNGRWYISDKDDAALIDLEKGWLWVSDTQPPNWSGATVSVGVAPPGTTQDGLIAPASTAAVPANQTWLSWSIINLINGRWSWLGSVGTKFIARLTGDGNTGLDSVYGIDDPINGSDATYTGRTSLGGKFQREDVPPGEQLRGQKHASPGNPVQTPPNSDDERFVKYVKCRVCSIGMSGAGSCDDQHTNCLNNPDSCSDE